MPWYSVRIRGCRAVSVEADDEKEAYDLAFGEMEWDCDVLELKESEG